MERHEPCPRTCSTRAPGARPRASRAAGAIWTATAARRGGTPTPTAGCALGPGRRGRRDVPAGRSTPAATSRARRVLPRGHGHVHRRRPQRAPPRAAAAQPVRLLDLPGELSDGDRAGPNQYGKAETRLVRVVRGDAAARASGPQRLASRCAGDFAAAHLTGDNAHVLPTDTQKNTVFAFARRRRRRRSRTSGCGWPGTSSRRTRDHRRPGGDRGVRLGRIASTAAHDHASPAPAARSRTAVVTVDGGQDRGSSVGLSRTWSC